MKKTAKKSQAPWAKAVKMAGKKKKQLNRKLKFWKIYFFLFVTLPIFIVMLTVRIVKTYVRIKLQKAAAGVSDYPQDEQQAHSTDQPHEGNAVS